MTYFYQKIYPYCKHKNDPEWENLIELEQKAVMQTFYIETGMIIFSDNKIDIVAHPS